MVLRITLTFYARGEALANYFKGNINCDGLINGLLEFRMDTDDLCYVPNHLDHRRRG